MGLGEYVKAIGNVLLLGWVVDSWVFINLFKKKEEEEKKNKKTRPAMNQVF